MIATTFPFIELGWPSLILGTSPPPPAPVNVTLPVITGPPVVGDTLTGSNGMWTNSPISFTYQWTNTTTGNIPGATSPTYVPQSSDLGDDLTITVIASNAGGSSSPATSAQVGPVTSPPPPPPLPPPPPTFPIGNHVIRGSDNQMFVVPGEDRPWMFVVPGEDRP
jgi:hypothetical protein